jgi:hypothetical protein
MITSTIIPQMPSDWTLGAGRGENPISGRCKKKDGIVATLERKQKLASERMHEIKTKPVATLERKQKWAWGRKPKPLTNACMK